MSNEPAAVKLSVINGVLEISGSETFVQGLIDNPKNLMALANEIQVATDAAQAQADKTKDSVDAAKDRKKAAIDSIAKLLEIVRGMNPQI